MRVCLVTDQHVTCSLCWRMMVMMMMVIKTVGIVYDTSSQLFYATAWGTVIVWPIYYSYQSLTLFAQRYYRSRYYYQAAAVSITRIHNIQIQVLYEAHCSIWLALDHPVSQIHVDNNYCDSFIIMLGGGVEWESRECSLGVFIMNQPNYNFAAINRSTARLLCQNWKSRISRELQFAAFLSFGGIQIISVRHLTVISLEIPSGNLSGCVCFLSTPIIRSPVTFLHLSPCTTSNLVLVS